MPRDMIFRAILMALSAVLYYNHHVLHGKPPSKKKRAPARGVELSLTILASLWALALVLYAAAVPFADYGLPLWPSVRWTGVGLMTLCIPLSNKIYRELGVHFSKKLELQPNHELVLSGPYRYVRHPMYSTLFLCAGSTCLISANLYVMATTVAVAVVILLRIKKEEVMLTERFGETYASYQRRTGALVPRLLQWHYARSTQ